MDIEYTLFVDESGQAGITKVRSGGSGGATPYMALGAALVPSLVADDVTAKLSKIAAKFGKPSLHCTELNHSQKVYYARTIAKEKVLFFGVLSLKATLGRYKDEIKGDPKRYYNKCAQYLLEKVGRFMALNDIDADRLSVCFEEGNFNYTALRSLVSKCRENPIYEDTRFLSRIEPMSIYAAPKGKAPLLQLGDLAAHALFRCADKSKTNYDIPEPRYLHELHRKFFSNPETGKIEGYGIKAVHELRDVKLDKDVHALIDSLSGPKKTKIVGRDGRT